MPTAIPTRQSNNPWRSTIPKHVAGLRAEGHAWMPIFSCAVLHGVRHQPIGMPITARSRAMPAKIESSVMLNSLRAVDSVAT